MRMNKYKILALFGKSGSGKDTIQNRIVFDNSDITNKIISYTTRPKRDYEQEGVDYYFIEPDVFSEKVLNGSMLEATSFRDWFYGTGIEQLSEDKINVGVFNIQGIECLLEDSRLEVLPVLIEVNNKKRLIRTLSREGNPDCQEVCRRFLADEKDFSLIPFKYETFYNEEDYSPRLFDSFDPIKQFMGKNN